MTVTLTAPIPGSATARPTTPLPYSAGVLSCDAAQLQLELRDLAALVPASAFRLGELAAKVRADGAALAQLVAYLEFLRAVPTDRDDLFAPAVQECLRLARSA